MMDFYRSIGTTGQSDCPTLSVGAGCSGQERHIRASDGPLDYVTQEVETS